MSTPLRGPPDGLTGTWDPLYGGTTNRDLLARAATRNRFTPSYLVHPHRHRGVDTDVDVAVRDEGGRAYILVAPPRPRKKND